jgi:twitching motility protein PilT
MSDSPSLFPQPLFGRLAVEKGFVTQAQLDQVLRLHAQLGGTTPLGALFVQRGLLSLVQVQDLLRLQRAAEQARVAAAPPPPPPMQPAAAKPRPAIGTAATAAAQPLVRNPFGSPAAAAANHSNVARAPTPTNVRPVQAVQPAQARPAVAAPARTPTPPAPMPAAPAPSPAESMPELDLIPEKSIPPPPSTEALQFKVGPKVGQLVFELLAAAAARGASDVHLHGGTPPTLRVGGVLVVLEQKPLDLATQERELHAILTPEQRKELDDSGDLDFALTLPSGLRARGNMYRSIAGLDAIFRLIASKPRSLEELQLPSAVAKLIAYHQGLVLVTGPTGCGKSTTLASLVHLLNEERAEHILSLEDPIEIIHPAMRALVNQRQVGRDTESFSRALRGALREDPDIIVIGDLRDRDTISLAITAAETGHLVIGSMNTNSASRTVGRLIDAFPPKQQGQVRAMLSESLRGVISQRLVQAVDGSRVPATELLIVTPAIGNLIREGKLFQIRSQMQTGRHMGMRTLDESLRDLVLNGKIDAEQAKLHAESPSAMPTGPAKAAEPPPQPAGQGTGNTGRPPARPGAPAPAAPARPPLGMPPRPPGRS